MTHRERTRKKKDPKAPSPFKLPIRHLSWFNQSLLVFRSNKHNPSSPNAPNKFETRSQSNLYACISSRITTAIHIVIKNNFIIPKDYKTLLITIKWIITDLMSHSQFHKYKLLILTHAWLNLWDKHMTTGRIDQIH